MLRPCLNGKNEVSILALKNMINKVGTVEEALAHIHSGNRVMVGGFGLVGVPTSMMKAIAESDLENLTIISNDGGRPDTVKNELMCSGKVKKLIATYVGANPAVGKLIAEGVLEAEMVPQGTFAERVRCGGYGLGGVLTPTAVGTSLAEGKQVLTVDGRDYLLELPLRADVAIVRAHRADPFGNLSYRYVGKNYNPYMAMAADFVIAEVDELAEEGSFSDSEIETPGIVVDMIVMRED